MTGGPGAGKTALLAALAAQGYEHVPEAARAIIRDRKRRGLPPRPSPAEFAQEILRVDVENYRNAPLDSDPIFFDRGIPDALGMLDELGLLTPLVLRRHLDDYPYLRKVFVAPPWREIYTTDEERDQSFDESVRVHDALREWYVRCGYEIVEIPRASIEARCAFVLRALELPHKSPE